jgi:phosphatidylserine/phosphatidylglycerophosphate/cardiolipin synthase-like enzyme
MEKPLDFIVSSYDRVGPAFFLGAMSNVFSLENSLLALSEFCAGLCNQTTTAKYFMIDDICCYIGSQNLYKCDLAEWGVVIDDAARVQAIKEEFWYVASRTCSQTIFWHGLAQTSRPVNPRCCLIVICHC